MATTSAHWKLLASDAILQRSSQTMSVVGDQAYVFGGELKPREPRDGHMHVVGLQDGTSELMSSFKTSGLTPTEGDGSIETLRAESSPTPRVGTASAVLESDIYVYSGRGGVDMAPIEESGSVWVFSIKTKSWTQVFPGDSTAPFPQARSYHCATSDGRSQLYIHAGCPTSGRLSDLWTFDVGKCSWRQLASAPDPPRGGSSVAYLDGKIYRMGGFDGKHELGGCIDVFDVENDEWSTINFKSDGVEGPGCRSVAALVAVQVGGRKSLVTLFGESDPSSLGHAGAGKMLSDAWLWDVEEQRWSKIISKDEQPQARGWFDAAVVSQGSSELVVVQGGLGENNERLSDVWALSF